MLQILSELVGVFALFLLIVVVVVGLSIDRERAQFGQWTPKSDEVYVPLQRTLDPPKE